MIERRIDGVNVRRHQERVTVGWRIDRSLGADNAARPRPVVDDELLAQPLRQILAHDARHNVGRAPGGKRHDPAHWLRRIGLRPRDARDDRERSSACCYMQKLSTL